MNLEIYRHHIPMLKYMVERDMEKYNKPHPDVDIVGQVSLATGVHIIAITYFFGELYTFTSEVTNKLEKLKEFYRIDRIDV